MTYGRDASGRIVQRTQTVARVASVVRYGFSGDGDSPDLVMDGAGALVARVLSLPGGVVVNLPVAGVAVWSYPNIHGDVIATADGAGTRSGALTWYDPFGQPVDPVTGLIGTGAADDAVPDNLPGDADNAWVGQHQKLYEHAGSLAAIEMGARVYLAGLGRFLSVDPVEGGVDNAYEFDLAQWDIEQPQHLSALGVGRQSAPGVVRERHDPVDVRPRVHDRAAELVRDEPGRRRRAVHGRHDADVAAVPTRPSARRKPT